MIALLKFSYFYIEACEDLPQAFISDSVKRLFEVCEVVKQTALVLHVLLCDELTIEDLFYCAPAWSKTCLFFCEQFRSLGLESVEDNLEHGLAGMAD